MSDSLWLEEIIGEYEKYKSLCERAASQVSDEDFLKPLSQTHHSIGMLMKHLGGNNRSRWRNFLTSDGEKDDRDRESEFVTVGESRASVMEKWEAGWKIAFENLRSITPEDLEKTITIRGEPHTVIRAIIRNLAHNVYHAGQIVLLAREICGEKWEFQSIPPGQSQEHNARMREQYGEWKG